MFQKTPMARNEQKNLINTDSAFPRCRRSRNYCSNIAPVWKKRSIYNYNCFYACFYEEIK